MDVNKIKERAVKELEEESFRCEVDKYKRYLKTKRSFWDFIPFKIIIIKKEK